VSVPFDRFSERETDETAGNAKSMVAMLDTKEMKIRG
jgi:hypothetical protein